MFDNSTVWLSLVAERRTSGKTAQMCATEHVLSVAALRSWSSRLGREEKRLTTPSIRLARVVRAPAIQPAIRMLAKPVQIVGVVGVRAAANTNRTAAPNTCGHGARGAA